MTVYPFLKFVLLSLVLETVFFYRQNPFTYFLGWILLPFTLIFLCVVGKEERADLLKNSTAEARRRFAYPEWALVRLEGLLKKENV